MPAAQHIDIVVVGAGAAGLTVAYSLRAMGLEPLADFIVLDEQAGPGGAWRSGWDFLTLREGLRSRDVVELPGQAEIDLGFSRLDSSSRIRDVLPRVWRSYEDAYDLFVAHTMRVTRVESIRSKSDLLVTARGAGAREPYFRASLLINATGTWTTPFVPWYRGMDRFRGEQRHAQTLEAVSGFSGRRVLVVGGGRTAVRIALELDRVGAKPFWSTRRTPDFHPLPRFSIASITPIMVGDLNPAVRHRIARLAARGKPMPSDVSVRGIPLTKEVFEGMRRGVLRTRGPVAHLEEDGVRFADGTREPLDAVIWATGGRESARHLAPLGLRDAGGTPKISGGWSRRDPRIAFVGYGPGVDTAGALDEAVRVGEDAIDRLVG